MTHILALLALAATTAALATLRAHTTPEPAYDWPVWAYRLALTIRAHLTRKHHT
jgi:hypothetical protein